MLGAVLQREGIKTAGGVIAPPANDLQFFFPVAASIENSTNFHRIPDYDIENGVVLYRNLIICVFSVMGRLKFLEAFGEGQSLPDRLFHCINKAECSDIILEDICEIVHDLVQIFLKQRKKAKFILLSHGYGP